MNVNAHHTITVFVASLVNPYLREDVMIHQQRQSSGRWQLVLLNKHTNVTYRRIEISTLCLFLPLTHQEKPRSQYRSNYYECPYLTKFSRMLTIDSDHDCSSWTAVYRCELQCTGMNCSVLAWIILRTSMPNGPTEIVNAVCYGSTNSDDLVGVDARLARFRSTVQICFVSLTLRPWECESGHRRRCPR